MNRLPRERSAAPGPQSGLCLPVECTDHLVMESSYYRRATRRRRERDKLVRKAIWRSIRGHCCPICYRDLEEHYREAAILTVCMHAYCVGCIRKWSNLKRKCPLCNANFNSWFCKLSLSSKEFQKEVLPFEGLTKNSHQEIYASHEDARRLLRRTRVALNVRRTRALPWRRSFGRPGFASPDVIAQRKLEWRASIYNQRLQAVPSTLSCFEQIKLRNSSVKEKMLQKIEPWIRRELQAVLGDADPTVMVQVATSQYFAWLEEKANLPSRQSDIEDRFISPLRPFLLDEASLFWHELRCFAESCYNIETYDAVVEYRNLA